MPTIYIVGDSTVENGGDPFHGWGWSVNKFAAPGVQVENHAIGGRSSRSFLDEGRFEPVREAMKAGDLLLIQFGHNDEKDDDNLHTDPQTSFKDCLSVYVDAAREKGVIPVLITSVCRRYYTGDWRNMLYTHGEYPAAVRQLAETKQVILADLKMATRQFYRDLGVEETAKLFVQIAPGVDEHFPDGHNDLTHYNAYGSRRVCALLVDLLKTHEKLKPYFA